MRESIAAVSRAIIIVVIIVIIIVAGVGAVLATSHSSTTTTSSVVSTSTPTSSSSTSSAPPVSSTSSSSSSSSSAAVNQTLVVDYTANPGSLDPRSDVEISGHGIFANIYQPVVYWNDSSTKQIVPILADNYSVSTNGSVYTFNIRPGVTFSNGDNFTAYDVWYTFYSANIMNQAAAVDYNEFVNLTGVNATQLNGHFSSSTNIPDSATQALAASSPGVQVPNANTVIFHLISAAPDFLAFMTSLDMVSAHYVDSNGGVTAGQPSNYVTLNPMGTGPFIMTSWVQNQQVTLVRNSHYWGGVDNVFPTPKLSEVVIRFVSDVTVRLNDLKTGVAQAAVTDWNHLNPGISTAALPNIGVSQTFVMIPLNTLRPPTNSLLVREAIAHAINFTAVDQGVYHGYIQPAMGPVSYGSSVGYDSQLTQYSYNLTLAKQLLAQVYPSGTTIPPLTFVWATDYPEGMPMGQIIQSELSQIGITVTLTSTSFANEINLFALPSNDTQAPNMGWLSCTWLPVPTACPSILIPSNAPINWPHFNSSEVDALWNTAKFQLNTTLRQQEYDQIAQIEYGNVTWLWVGQYLDAFPAFPILFSNTVQGLYYNSAFSEVDFSTVYISSS
jgi:peptide/nickel transport system substrate-binding protein